MAAWRSVARTNMIAVAAFSVVVNLLMLTMPLYLFQISDRVLTSVSYALKAGQEIELFTTSDNALTSSPVARQAAYRTPRGVTYFERRRAYWASAPA
jgi:hypothetical protein